jgi:FkbM family methyltransferase
MNVAFWDNQLGERGTSVSLYDYAHYNETLLGNKSFIFYNKHQSFNNEHAINKFNKRFDIVHETNDFEEVDDYLIKYNIKIIYIIKGGEKDNHFSKVAKNCIHCVFHANDPHGDVYSTIAPWVNGNNGKYPVVPHMINLPQHDKNMRDILNIPKDAVVFGGYGGSNNFSITFAQQIVHKIAKNNKNIYFLFANFNKFCEELPNIIHLSIIVDLDEKVKFINTCDAMIWARGDGEVMSLSMGEFSSKNKPIICMNIGYPGHVNLLGSNAIWYNNSTSLYNILTNFNPEIEKNKDWNAYKEYTPEKVMQIFKNTFLDNIQLCNKTITYNETFFGLHDLDKKLLKYINYKNGVFIECGANNGIAQSNTLYYERNLEWKGLLVEPNKSLYEQCKLNRPNSIVENYALVSKNYKKSTILGNFNCACGLTSMITDKSDYFDPHLDHERSMKNKNHIVEVNVITLTELLITHNIQTIDFFSLDVEGYEIDVLNGLDFSIFRPKYILIETENREVYQNAIRTYMKEKKYNFIERLSVNDDIFIAEELIN